MVGKFPKAYSKMLVIRGFLVALLITVAATAAQAQIFGTLRVIARDPQNLAVANANVLVKARSSQWTQMGKTNGDGEVLFQACSDWTVPGLHHGARLRRLR